MSFEPRAGDIARNDEAFLQGKEGKSAFNG
jgi:hypothetical protein